MIKSLVKTRDKLRKNKKGFTLIELLVVIAILAVLAAILIPLVGGFINNAKSSAANADAHTVFTAAASIVAQNPDHTYGSYQATVTGTYSHTGGGYVACPSTSTALDPTNGTDGVDATSSSLQAAFSAYLGTPGFTIVEINVNGGSVVGAIVKENNGTFGYYGQQY